MLFGIRMVQERVVKLKENAGRVFHHMLSAHGGTIVKLWVAASLRKHTSDYLGVSVESHSSHHFLCARCVAAEGFGLIVCLLVIMLVRVPVRRSFEGCHLIQRGTPSDV